MVGELGQENPGASALDPQYVKNTIAGALSTGIPNGHNGLFAWIWAWCDTNTMLQDVWKDASGQDRNDGYDADSPLTSHGVLWRDNYYNKVVAPPVSTPVSPLPTDHNPPTATIRPSATVAPTARPTGDGGAERTPTAGLDCVELMTAGGKKIYICIQ